MVKEKWLTFMAGKVLLSLIDASHASKHRVEKGKTLFEERVLKILRAHKANRPCGINGGAQKLWGSFLKETREHYEKEEWAEALNRADELLTKRLELPSKPLFMRRYPRKEK